MEFNDLIEKAQNDLRVASKLGKIKVNNYHRIIFCGMGGSSVPGEVVRALDLKVPVYITRDKLPSFADTKTLCFIVSYSGNTIETINLYKKAKAKKCKIVIITSGGRLGRYKEDRVLIPGGYLPRDAFFYLLIPILNILKIKITKGAYEVVKKIKEKEIVSVAKKIKNKMPIIYAGSEDFKAVSQRWETQFDENSKVLAHSDFFPEAAHNEIEAKFGKDKKVILLIDEETKQIKRAKKFLRPIEIKLKGKNKLEKIIYGIYFGDLVSIYLAELLNVNRKSMKKISYIKG